MPAFFHSIMIKTLLDQGNHLYRQQCTKDKQDVNIHEYQG